MIFHLFLRQGKLIDRRKVYITRMEEGQTEEDLLNTFYDDKKAHLYYNLLCETLRNKYIVTDLSSQSISVKVPDTLSTFNVLK